VNDEKGLDSPPPHEFWDSMVPGRFESRWAKQMEEKRDKLAQAIAHGLLKTKAQRKALAQELQVSVEHVEGWILHPELMPRVTDIIRLRALHATAEALDAQTGKAQEGDVAAFKALAQVAKVLEPGGVKVQSNTFIDKRDMGDNDSDRKFFDRFQKRSQGKFQIVEGTVAEDIDPD
jgi:hypothetical protein